MANMIKELWYGNIIHQEDGIFSKPQFKELFGYMSRHREALEDVKNWLGHADIETTSNIYLHYGRARKVLLANDLVGMFNFVQR